MFKLITINCTGYILIKCYVGLTIRVLAQRRSLAKLCIRDVLMCHDCGQVMQSCCFWEKHVQHHLSGSEAKRSPRESRWDGRTCRRSLDDARCWRDPFARSPTGGRASNGIAAKLRFPRLLRFLLLSHQNTALSLRTAIISIIWQPSLRLINTLAREKL